MKRQGLKTKLILGITGSFGSGKTTVAGIFKSFGAQVIDADKIARKITCSGAKIYKEITYVFGKGILKQDKSIDRHKLGRIVFNNKRSLARLNKITHPEIIRIIKEKIKTSKAKLIILDAPLLLETGLKSLTDKLIVVKAGRDWQITRALNRTSLSKAEILKRIECQMSLKFKVRLADFVIDNSGTIENTKRQVENIWKKMSLSLAAEKKK